MYNIKALEMKLRMLLSDAFKKTRVCLIYPLSILFVMSACNTGGGGGGPVKPKIAGRTGEVIVVMNKAQWNGQIGNQIKEVLAQAYPALPQFEPAFDLINIPPDAFSSTFQLNRNIVSLKLNTGAEPKFEIQRDVWAQPQLVINLYGSNEQEILVLIEENEQRLVDLFESAERKRIMQTYKSAKKTSIDQKLRMAHDVGLTVPSNYNLDVDTGNFVWISHETPETSQGIFIYYYDYTDENTFTSEYLIDKRNEFLRKYVPGPAEGSYMSTEQQYPVQFNEYSYQNDRYIAVMRGLWRVENAFMGGPFLSITTLDEARNRVVTFEGYAYAPRKDKRNFVRQLEAILFSFEIMPPEENEGGEN